MLFKLLTMSFGSVLVCLYTFGCHNNKLVHRYSHMLIYNRALTTALLIAINNTVLWHLCFMARVCLHSN